MVLAEHNVSQQTSSDDKQLSSFSGSFRPKLTIQVPEVPFTTLHFDRSAEKNPKAPTKHYLTQDGPFNLLHAILGHDELLFYLMGTWLPPRDFFNLYSASRAFFIKVNLHKSSYILSVARNWAHITDPCPTAPLSNDLTSNLLSCPPSNLSNFVSVPKAPHIITYALYRKHRFLDGEGEPQAPGQMQSQTPDFSYLRFLHDETVAAEEIIRTLWQHFGLRLPANSLSTMTKLALLMLSRRNGLRVTLLEDKSWFTDADIFRAETLFMRLEMAFADALYNSQARVGPGNLEHYTGSGARSFRQLMCAQYGWGVCARKMGGDVTELSHENMMRLLADYAMIGQFHNEVGQAIFGVEHGAIGRLSTEEVIGANGKRVRGRQILVNIEDLISRESSERNLRLDQWVVEMLTCGFYDPETKRLLPAAAGT